MEWMFKFFECLSLSCISVIIAFCSLIFAFFKWRIGQVDKRKEKRKEVAQIATTLYESISGIETYVKTEHSSTHIEINPKWEEALMKCDFLTPAERQLVRDIHREAIKHYDSWRKRDRFIKRKEDSLGYNALQDIFFEKYDYSINHYNRNKHTKRYDNLLSKLKKYMCEED